MVVTITGSALGSRLSDKLGGGDENGSNNPVQLVWTMAAGSAFFGMALR